MVELRSRKPVKAATKEKEPLKRKAGTGDEASPTAPKKQKKVAKPKEPKRSESIKKRKEEKPVEEEDENEASESDTEAQALAKIVDSDAEADDASPDEEIKDLDLPKVSKDVVKAAADSETGEPGVVYIGRIPRGFYEHQMREYFTQFGEVNKIRMSRNKATGQSKHFAFIEFAELGVAEIVTKTMDNYLLSGHILKVKMVPKSQIHEKLWVGANRRFKKIPWNKMAGNKLKKPLTESTWTEKISKEEAKRSERAKKLQEIGYEFEAPKLKGVHGAEEDTAALEEANDDAPKAIEAAPKSEKAATSKSTRGKKAAKGDAPKAVEAAPQSDEASTSKPAPAAKKAAKAKEDKKPAAKTTKKGKSGKKA